MHRGRRHRTGPRASLARAIVGAGGSRESMVIHRRAGRGLIGHRLPRGIEATGVWPIFEKRKIWAGREEDDRANSTFRGGDGGRYVREYTIEVLLGTPLFNLEFSGNKSVPQYHSLSPPHKQVSKLARRQRWQTIRLKNPLIRPVPLSGRR